MRRIAAVVTVIGLAACGVTRARPDLGPSPCGSGHEHGLVGIDPQRGTVRWTVGIDDHNSQVSTDGQSVFADAGDGKIAAYNATDGSLRWCVAQPGAPTDVVDGLVMVVHGRRLTALDAGSGARRWESTVAEGERVPPPGFGTDSGAQAGMEVVSRPGWAAATTGGAIPQIVGLSLADGSVVWTHHAPDHPPPSPHRGPGPPAPVAIIPGATIEAADDTRVYLSEANVWSFVALDGRTGRELWRRQHLQLGDGRRFGGHRADLAGSGVILQGSEHSLVAFDAATGQPRWEVDAPASNTRIAAGSAYAIEQEGLAPGNYEPPTATIVRAFDAATGAKLWQARVPLFTWHTSIAGDAVVISGYEDVAAIDATTGRLRWQTRHPSPVTTSKRSVANGYGHVVAAGGLLVGLVSASEPYRD